MPESGASGVIVSLGAGIGGWSLYAHEGKLKHCYNFFGIEKYFAESDQEIPAGKHQVRLEFSLRRRRPGQGRHGVALCRRPERR